MTVCHGPSSRSVPQPRVKILKFRLRNLHRAFSRHETEPEIMSSGHSSTLLKIIYGFAPWIKPRAEILKPLTSTAQLKILKEAWHRFLQSLQKALKSVQNMQITKTSPIEKLVLKNQGSCKLWKTDSQVSAKRKIVDGVTDIQLLFENGFLLPWN